MGRAFLQAGTSRSPSTVQSSGLSVLTPSPWGAGGFGLRTGAASQLLRPLTLGFRGDQSHNSGRPLPMVVNKRSQEKEKDKNGDVSSQYVLYSMKCPQEE